MRDREVRKLKSEWGEKRMKGRHEGTAFAAPQALVHLTLVKSGAVRVCRKRVQWCVWKRCGVRMNGGEGEAMYREAEVNVRAELEANGVDFDRLLNSGKVVQLWIEVMELENGGVLSKKDEERLENIRGKLERECRSTMGDWLKRTFEVQAVVLGLVGGVLATDLLGEVVGNVPLVGRALGFWMVWLFTIPSLRARKGTRIFEKSALNVAFVATPIVNIGLGSLTRNTGMIWAADVALLIALYMYYGVKSVITDDDEVQRVEGKVTGVLRYLDWGSWR